MKVFIICVLLMAGANAASISNIGQKLMPKFITGYITNGEEATPHSAPNMVSISEYFLIPLHMCGGSIISNKWVLTAAHCIIKSVGMGVFAGYHTLYVPNGHTQSRRVVKSIKHDQYSGDVGPYDIGLLGISEPWTFDAYVNSIALPYQNQTFENEVHLYGWGLTEHNAILPPLKLQTVITKLLNYNECKPLLLPKAPIHETNVCTDSMQEKISACSGDSGGPLAQMYTNGETIQVGIVSWGYIPCGEENLPSVYTSTAAFAEWIQTNIV